MEQLFWLRDHVWEIVGAVFVICLAVAWLMDDLSDLIPARTKVFFRRWWNSRTGLRCFECGEWNPSNSATCRRCKHPMHNPK
jgi:hypothetical protein